MKLMIVDDSSMVRGRVARIVAQGRLPGIAQTAQARDGREALQIAQRLRPELVTMDLTMPELDGLACIPPLLELLPDASVLVLSALDDKSTAIQALRRGARGFLSKPFGDDELVLALMDLMDGRR
ncbi:response regulator [Caldimonas tepidiphila]|uniref:response regulator n=1 Tax=Caldimonas tepidiphila TaxID=2315841 RepID=UPI000E5A6CAF|nr:response regulator [Caldimonas tepidiphila]